MEHLPKDYMGCWHVMHCGREPGGRNAEKLGVCVSARFPGSACWLVAGKPHEDRTQVCYRVKEGNSCTTCQVYQKAHEPLPAVQRVTYWRHNDNHEGPKEFRMGTSWLDAIGY